MPLVFSMNFMNIFSFLFATLFLSSIYAKRKFISGTGGDGIFSNIALIQDWNLQKSAKCPQNEYVIGASIRTSNIPKSRVTSITAFRLQCSDRIRGKSSTTSIEVGKYYEETGDWQAPQECLRGFVVGVFIYLNSKPKDERSGMPTGSYASGMKLVCQEGQSAAISNQTGSSSSSVQFGVPVGKELAVVCPIGQVTNEVGVGLKSVILIEHGESLYPSDLMITCAAPKHPLIGCEIELEFEPISTFNCNPYAEREYSLAALMGNLTLGSQAEIIFCNFSTIKGVKLNEDISNLKEIIFAYESLGIETTSETWMAYVVLLKMEELEFKVKWDNLLKTHSVPPPDPQITWYSFIKLSDLVENFKLYDSNPRKTLTFMNLAEFVQSNKAINQPDVKLTHSIKIEQLVGYCSVFKLYFPIVRKAMSGFVSEKKGKINKVFEFV